MDTESYFTPLELERYSTQLCLAGIGIAGQKLLKNASVVVIGAGGLGSPALLYLAAAGFGRIGIVDHDRVSLSNLQRQILFSVDDIGELKCKAAKQKCAMLNPHVQFEDHNVLFVAKNGLSIIHNYDIVVDATDNFETRYIINDLSVAAKKPFIYGSIHAYEGQVAVFAPGASAPNYRSLFPTPPEPGAIPTCATGGVIGALAGVVGSIQAIEAVKLIVQPQTDLRGKLLRIDALTWNVRQYKIDPHEHDPIQIDMEKAKQLQNEMDDLLIIDVRDGSDLPLKFPQALRIPFDRLTSFPDLPRDKYILLYCNRGVMSTQAALILRNQFKYPYVYALV